MASALIQERGTVSGNQMRMQRIIEDAGQTFLAGTPLMINNVTGGLKAWDGVTIANGIAGISKEFGVNLATAGVSLGQTSGAGAIPPLAGGQTFGSVQNESGAVNFSRPLFNDGRTGIVLAVTDTQFYGQVGSAQAAPSITDIGKSFGLTKDADNHWFVDRTKVGGAAVLQIVGLDQWDTTRGVIFTFLPGIAQIIA